MPFRPQSPPVASPPAYAELQVTTNFSFLRGGSHGEELVATAKALGLAGLAVTDRNTLAGVVRAHAAAKEAGLQFAVGARLDLTPSPAATGGQRDGLAGAAPASLLCFPTDRAAYGRLCRLLTLGQRRADKGQCMLFAEDVAAHSDGQILIALPPEDWSWRDSLRTPADERTDIVDPTTRFARQLLALRHALAPTRIGGGARLYLAEIGRAHV